MTKKLLILALLSLLASCMDSAGRKGRPLIKDFSIEKDEENTCYLVYTDWLNGTLTNYSHACQTSCPTGTKIATTTEKEEIISAQASSTDKDSARTVLETVKALCIAENVTRPTDQIIIKSDFCSCLNGKADIINACDSFCAQQTSTAQATLYVNTTMGPEIANHPKLGNLYKWCTVEIGTAPDCVLELVSNGDTQTPAIKVTEGSNSFTVNINNVLQDRPYVATILDRNSGARSKSFQIYRRTTDTSTDVTGPLKLQSASLYSCIKKSGSSQGSNTYTDQAIRVHYYFAADKQPNALASADSFLICHDTQQYGETDSPLYPRLELIPDTFLVWNETDIRFSDLDGTGQADIYDLIEKRLQNEFNVNTKATYPNGIKIFGAFTWPNGPTTASSTGSSAPRIGYFMQPWIDKTTQRAFCPTQQHYENGPDPIFKVLKNIIGVPTEAVYLAERQALTLKTTDSSGNVTTSTAPQDVLIIREAQLKKVWFYRENGKDYPGTELKATQKTIMFYWPIKEGADPLTPQPGQVIYSVKAPSDIGVNQTQSTSGSLSTTYTPSDKRFGCIPASGN